MIEHREQALEFVSHMSDREFASFFYDIVERRAKPAGRQKFGLIWLSFEDDYGWLFDTIAKPIGAYCGNASKDGFYVWMCSECNFHVVSFSAAARCPVCDHELKPVDEIREDGEQAVELVSHMTDRDFATFFYDVMERRTQPVSREKFGLIWLNFADDDVWEYDMMAKPIDAYVGDTRQDRLSAWRCPGCRFPVVSFSTAARCPVCEHELNSYDV